MKIKNPGEMLALTALTAILVGAGRDMLPLSQPIAYILLAIAILSALLTIETMLDCPVIARLVDVLHARRARREAADRAAADASMRAAFEEGLAKTKAYAATRRR